jgi:hypothetical protein
MTGQAEDFDWPTAKQGKINKGLSARSSRFKRRGARCTINPQSSEMGDQSSSFYFPGIWSNSSVPEQVIQ